MEIIKDSALYVDRLQELYDDAVDWADSMGVDVESAVEGLDIQIGDVLVLLVGQVSSLLPQALLCLMFTIYMLMAYDETQDKPLLQQKIDKAIRKYIIIKVRAECGARPFA